MKHCLNCQIEFTGKLPQQKFCTVKCREEFRLKNLQPIIEAKIEDKPKLTKEDFNDIANGRESQEVQEVIKKAVEKTYPRPIMLDYDGEFKD